MGFGRRGGRLLQADFLGPLGVGALLGYLGANARTALNYARASGEPSAMGALQAGAKMLQSKAPLDAIGTYLNAFHFYADDMGRQIEAHHFCTHLSHEMHQCVIFDSNQPGARLIGIEYIVSERLFRELPEEEKPLWHSHHYEVKSGELVAPGLPEPAERAAVAHLVNTYGKTFHTWQVDRDKDVPLGIPQLMMAFTADGQVDAAALAERDRRVGISSEDRRRTRADIPMPTLVPGANAWEATGEAMQTELRPTPLRNRR